VNNIKNLRHPGSKRNGKLAFFLGFLRHPNLVASIIPSSKYVERRLVKVAGIAQAKLVVELGPGVGGTTQAILNSLPPEAKLMVMEVNPDFAQMLRSHPDPRLIVYQGSAEDIQQALELNNLRQPDAVISGIPFSTMPSTIGQNILQAVWTCLAADGCFVAYQFKGKVALLGKEILGRPKCEFELLNVPPVRMYCWQKSN
jgi:phospholipid N-methyltransferase